MLFDKRKQFTCIRCRAISHEENASKWHERELMYPIQAINGKEMSEIQEGSILVIDLDGLGGANKDEVIRVQVVDPKLVLCKSGFIPLVI